MILKNIRSLSLFSIQIVKYKSTKKRLHAKAVLKVGGFYRTVVRQGCEDLIQQLVGFGVEKHDDLADAFSLLINATLDKHSNEGTIMMCWLGGGDDDGIIYYPDYVDIEPTKNQ